MKSKTKFTFKNMSLRARIILIFALFGVSILLVLWLLQVVFLGSYYQTLKKNEIINASKQIQRIYGQQGFEEKAAEIAFKNELNIAIFTTTANPNIIIINFGTGEFDRQQLNFSQQSYFTEVLDKLSDKDSVFFISDSRPEFKEIIYGARIQVNTNGTVVYMLTKSPMVILNSTRNVLIGQLLIVSAVVLVIAIVLAIFLSRSISNPLTKITKEAQKLAKGNFNVQFNQTGYREIVELGTTLQYATDELNKTDNLRKDLIANISHELRTPLTMIKAYGEMIKDISGNKPSERNKHLDIILDETERLKTLVTDFLELSRLQSGIVEYRKKEFNVSCLFTKVGEHFKNLYADFEFTFNITPDVFITADENKMEQVFINLISNAVNYSDENKKVSLSLYKPENSVIRAEVTDSGKGISPSDLPQIFDKYFRANSVKRTKAGSGIGLSIVKSILEGHGFKYGATSEIGKGSCFYIELPHGQ